MKEKPPPHPHKSRVTRVLILDDVALSVENLYWKVACPVCGDLSLHKTWLKAVIKASDHPELWDFAKEEARRLAEGLPPQLYTAKNEISERFYPR